MLQNSGLTVDQAENGQVALNRVGEQDYDLLLMDMQMPVMDGLTATRKLREQGHDVPIVALTANVMQQHQQRCTEAGCTTFLTKPVNIDRLLETIAEFLPTQPPPAEQNSADELPQCEPEGESDRPPSVIVKSADSAQALSPVDRLDGVMKLVDEALSDVQPKSRAVPRTSRLQSTLPMDIDEFRTIVCGFVDILPSMMAKLRKAWESRNFEELHGLAHKLKGTGGTVGFPAFTAPAAELQDNAEDEIEEGTEELLLTIEALAASVEAPAPV